MRPKRYSLAIELTSFCNQKCGYCYNGWRDDGGKSIGSLPTQELLAVIDRALTEVEFDHVTLTGGEPFSRRDVFEVMDLCVKHGVGIQIISNGGLITDEIAARLAPYRPRFVQVTLNGPDAALHEEHVGSGHWEKTLRGIEALRAHGVTLVGCVVITRKNAHVVGATIDLLRSYGARSVSLSRFSPAGFAAGQVAELLPSRSELVNALTQADERGRDHKMDLQVTMPVPECVIGHEEFPHVRFSGCPIGTSMQEFALGPQGELRNCTLHEKSIGDSKTTSFAELVVAPEVMHYRDVTPEFCAPCVHVKTCIGGCGAASEWTLGGRDRVDPFVAQHVDDEFGARLRATRKAPVLASNLVPVSSLVR